MNEGVGPRSPEVPKPLLMAAWEAHIEQSVDTILSMGASTTKLYSQSGPKVDAEPLFFHVSLILIKFHDF